MIFLRYFTGFTPSLQSLAFCFCDSVTSGIANGYVIRMRCRAWFWSLANPTGTRDG